MARSWSFSRLGDFEKCKKYFWLKHEQKIAEPERPLPKGKLEHGNERGSRVHDNLEGYVRGDHDSLCPEAEKHFGVHVDLLRTFYAAGMVELEGDWGMDRDWEIAPWDSAFLRLKLDALVHFSETEAYILDYKTGAKFYNEVKHMQQLQLYALVAFLRFPELEVVEAALWYIDGHGITSQVFTRNQALQFKRSFDKRGNALVNCTDWPASANRFSCQFCMYGPEHSGHCSEGVRKA